MLPVVTYTTNGTVIDKGATLNNSNKGSTSPSAIYLL